MNERKTNLVTPFASLGTAVLGGGILGALTNAVNGRVSPLYFQRVMRWDDVEDIASATIAQGIFEGLLMGLFLGLVFVVSVSAISKLRADIIEALALLGKIFGSAFIVWIIGGLLAIGLAILSPEFYRSALIGVPEETELLLPYAWVGGSIWGIQFGGFVLLVVWLVVFAIQFKSKSKSEQGGGGNVASRRATP